MIAPLAAVPPGVRAASQADLFSRSTSRSRVACIRGGLFRTLLVLGFLALGNTASEAQVSVIPDGGSTSAQSHSSSGEAGFEVHNLGGTTETVSLSCSVSGAVASCQVFPTSAHITASDYIVPFFSFSTGDPGSGTVTLHASAATGSDDGWYDVTVEGPALPEGPPTVALRNHNGDTRNRSLCLTSGAGEAAAWQCGDLLVAHALPAYVTLNRERSLTLLYNSAQAAPRVTVAAAVTEGGNVAPPQSVYAELHVSGALRASATYSPWGSDTEAETRQIVLGYDASADTTGAYPFTLTVTNDYGLSAHDTTVSGTLIVANRSQSEFGQGWSLAGVERLVTQADSSFLWLSGDGSANIYAPTGADTWVAAAGGFRDTLRYSSGTELYTRTLRHGIQVRFDAAGRHVETVNRAGQKTTFFWSVSPERLDSIRVPPAGVLGTTYTLAYDGNGYLDGITDPAGRLLEATVASGRLAALIDPDGHGPGFSYDSLGRMAGRTTRRGFETRFAYANDLRVTEVKVPLDTATGDTATTAFEPWDEKGLAFGIGALGGTTVDTAAAYTRILGPRPSVPDNATFWVDRWGAPVKIVGAVNDTTLITRGDTLVPALVIRVEHPNHRIVKMSWDARGNLTEMRDSTAHIDERETAVTTYTYEDPNTQDSPDQVTDPEELTTLFAYNSMGLTQQATAPNGHLTEFEYRTSGSLKGLLTAVVEHDVFVYDSALSTEVLADPRTTFEQNALGNDSTVTSPMGHVTVFLRDSAQRVQHFYDPMGHHTELHHDALNRRTLEIVHGPGGPSGPRADTTRYTYNVDVIDSVIDPRRVVRQFRYDAANQPTQEIDDFGNVEVRFFDEAGLVDSLKPRYTNAVIRHTYDEAGRRRKVAWPARDAAADSILYAYDEMSRIVTATTSVRRIEREYFANDLLKKEIQSNANGTSPMTHKYGYDLAGRRTFYRVGNDASNDSTWYTYDPASGDLRAIGVRWRDATRDSVIFRWDPLGRRDTLKYTNGIVVGFAYDGDGRFRRLCSKHTPDLFNPPNPDVFKVRVAHPWVDPDGSIRLLETFGADGPDCPESNSTLAYSLEHTYDFKHQLASQTQGGQITTYEYDASGNMTRREAIATNVYEILPLHNALAKDHYGGPGDYVLITYDAAGARVQEQPFVDGNTAHASHPRWRDYWYDGLGRTTGTTEHDGGGNWVGSPYDCQYDPLGRMFDPCENIAVSLGFDGENVTRTGYDGQSFTWTFVHGPGTDDPLMGFKGSGVGECTDRLYWITDGQGREWARGNPEGFNCSPSSPWSSAADVDSKFAGTTSSATGFDATRYPNDGMDKLSFFRHRFYDRETGRWTQEDPIGVAGGINLYSYVGNDPVNFTDPFGLCPEGLRDEDGLCPGGLSVDQWNRVEDAAENLHAESKAGLLQLLNEGQITPGQLPPNVGMRTGFLLNPTRIVTNTTFGRRRNVDVLFLQSSDVAFMFAHELGHHEQASTFFEKLVLGARKMFGFDAEADANAHACSAVLVQGILTSNRCN